MKDYIINILNNQRESLLKQIDTQRSLIEHVHHKAYHVNKLNELQAELQQCELCINYFNNLRGDIINEG